MGSLRNPSLDIKEKAGGGVWEWQVLGHEDL